MLNIDGLFHDSACTYIVYYSNILTTIQKFEYTYVNHFKRHSVNNVQISELFNFINCQVCIYHYSIASLQFCLHCNYVLIVFVLQYKMCAKIIYFIDHNNIQTFLTVCKPKQ